MSNAVKRINKYFRLGIVFVILSVILFGFSVQSQENPKYIIIMLADSLRYDHLGCYGYDKITTPFIDKKSKQGIIFENAFTSGSWTITAVASLFSGLYPFQHKTNNIYKDVYKDWNALFKSGEIFADVLSPNILTLAEALKKKGYKTFGLYAFPSIGKRLLFGQGFDIYMYREEYDDSEFSEFRKIFEEHKDNKIFFYIHYTSPHAPYINFDEEISRDFENNNKNKIKDYPFKQKIPTPCKSHHWEIALHKNIGDCLLGYDKEIYGIDQQFKKLWEFLEKNGYLNNTFLIFLADHGQCFGEHGDMFHGEVQYEETIHIPLIIWDFSSRRSGRVSKVVSIIDIMPTVLERLGIRLRKNQGYAYYGKNILNDKNLSESRGIIAERPSKEWKNNLRDLGSIVYRTANKKIFLKTTEENMSYYMINENKEIELKDDSRFKDEKEAFIAILTRIKESYNKKDTIGKTTQIDEEAVKKLKSLGYLH